MNILEEINLCYEKQGFLEQYEKVHKYDFTGIFGAYELIYIFELVIEIQNEIINKREEMLK